MVYIYKVYIYGIYIYAICIYKMYIYPFLILGSFFVLNEQIKYINRLFIINNKLTDDTHL